MPRNPRIKKQKYCSALVCQNARKRSFDRETSISKAKLSQHQRNKRWRDIRPAHEYQREYRDAHPEYVERNRELQIQRNKKGQNDPAKKIVKTDALLLRPLSDGAYAGFKVKNGKIVKTDTLLLQMQAQRGVDAFSRIESG